MAPQPEAGIITIPSHHSVDETVKRVENALAAKGVKLFALIDHSGEAEKAGLRMPNTKLLIFGNPKAGTPLMLAAPSIATGGSGSPTTLPPISRRGIICRRNCSRRSSARVSTQWQPKPRNEVYS